MECKLIEKMFEQYMDGELDPEAEAEIERHISGCPDCSDKFTGYVKIKKGLSSVEDEPLPAQFHTAWTEKIKESSQPKPFRETKFYKYMPAIAAGIAAIAIVSAALLSGVLSPAPGIVSYSAGEAEVQDSSLAGGGAPENNERNAAPAEEGSLFMAQLAPEEASEAAAASEAESARKAADTAPEPESAVTEPLQVFVSQETLDSMIAAFNRKQIEYAQDETGITVDVTDANQETIAAVFKDNNIELCAVPGGKFKFSISE